ncbi:hypothetical protein ACFL6W_07600 [Thermodesulfobacteriota bacterium]
MKKLKPGWYILLYHDISWEENSYLQAIGGTCPPDLFRQHLKTLVSLGELVSVQEGEKRLRDGSIDAPIFSLWFDDGLIGVEKYAIPILDELGIAGAISICNRFVNRTEFYWRFKLSYLNSIDGMRFLRSRLKKHGLKRGDSVRTFTLEHFSLDILSHIEELYQRFTTLTQRNDAFRMFINSDSIKPVFDRGWVIANHTAGHYTVSPEYGLQSLFEEFQECEVSIKSICQSPSQHWVLPFDRPSPLENTRTTNGIRGDRCWVVVGNRRNTSESYNNTRVLYRISAPIGLPRELTDQLIAAQSR